MTFTFFRIICRFVRSSLVMAFVSGAIVRKFRRKVSERRGKEEEEGKIIEMRAPTFLFQR